MSRSGEAIASQTLEGDESEPPLGEFFGVDMGRPVSKNANNKIKSLGNGNTVVDLGSLGVHNTKNVRFRDSDQKGFVKVYIRTKELASDHKTETAITVSLLAIGAVITGIAALKHHK